MDLYENPLIWNSYLVDEDIIKKLKQRNTPINPNHTEIYCFYLPNGGTQWCVDRSFRLNDANNKTIIIAGAGLALDEEQLSNNKYLISDVLDNVILKFYKLLSKCIEGNITPLPTDFLQRIKNLTVREKEVLECIFYGLTAKQISTRLKLSIRTVETHLNKLKLACSSKSELITNAIESNMIQVTNLLNK